MERELGNLAMLSDGLAKFIIDLRQNILEIIVSHGGNTAILGHLIKDLDMLELNVLCTNLITSIKCNNSAITDLLLEHLKKALNLKNKRLLCYSIWEQQ
ncbi:MAG: hypothetical protein HWD59_04910 [Coxiellaceae bacterium]|nr:MAG: hypothetical protein HWD59_04910 [Coxiellaceae bacterium]